MGVTPEMIEQLEARWQRAREAGIVDQPVTSTACHNEAPRVVYTTVVKDRTAVYTATPKECVPSSEGVKGTFFATTVTIEQRRACGVQSLDVEFRVPALIQEDGVFIRVTQEKGRQRFQAPGDWCLFDIGLPFIGSKDARRQMKCLGASIR